MKYLICSDLHLEERYLSECSNIINELCKYTRITRNSHTFVFAGDWFHKKIPTIKELIKTKELINEIKKYFINVIFIEGNHDCSINNSPLEIYNDINLVKDYSVDKELFVGHFFTDKSNIPNILDYTKLDNYKNYQYILLGHYHKFTKLQENAWHLGSLRYVSHDEDDLENKYCAMYDDQNKELEFNNIFSYIPSKTYTLNELKKIDNFNYKVRLILNSFKEHLDNIEYIKNIQNKFINFKIKMNYTIQNIEHMSKKIDNKLKHINFEDLINQIDNQEIKDIIKNVYK